MKRYTVLEKSFINDRLVEAGEVVEYAGEPGANLKLVEDHEHKVKPGKGKPKDGAEGDSDLA